MKTNNCTAGECAGLVGDGSWVTRTKLGLEDTGPYFASRGPGRWRSEKIDADIAEYRATTLALARAKITRIRPCRTSMSGSSQSQFEPVQSESLTSVCLLLSATLILLLPNRQVADLENGSSGSES